MNAIYPIIGFIIAFVLFFAGYIFKNRPMSKVIIQASYAILFISLILLFWWGIMRAIGKI